MRRGVVKRKTVGGKQSAQAQASPVRIRQGIMRGGPSSLAEKSGRTALRQKTKRNDVRGSRASYN